MKRKAEHEDRACISKAKSTLAIPGAPPNSPQVTHSITPCISTCCHTVRRIVKASLAWQAENIVKGTRPRKLSIPELLGIMKSLDLEIVREQEQPQDSPQDEESKAETLATHVVTAIHHQTDDVEQHPPQVVLDETTNLSASVTFFEDPPLKWASLRAHHRDTCIIFDDKPHLYRIHGEGGYTSCTTLIHKFFPPFDPVRESTRMVNRPDFTTNKNYAKYQHLLTDASTGEQVPKLQVMASMRQEWVDNGVKESGLGTAFHLCAEHFYNSIPVTNDSKEYAYLMEYHREIEEERDWVVLRTEIMVWLDLPKRTLDGSCAGICGSVDMIYIDRVTSKLRDLDAWRRGDPGVAPLPIHLVDWKRSKDIKFNAFKNATGYGCCSVLPNCNYYQYGLQLNLYKYMLEQKYNVKVLDMAILVCHPNAGTKLRPPQKGTFKEYIIEDTPQYPFSKILREMIKTHRESSDPFKSEHTAGVAH